MIDNVHDTYNSELNGNNFAYDGENSLFTVGALLSNKLEFIVVLEDVTSNKNGGNANSKGHDSPNKYMRKSLRRSYQSKAFKVEISLTIKILMQLIQSALIKQTS
ncbi:hypothetical protein REPUB_Repub12eG0012200 [Reevesia pubescens]